MSQVWCQSGGIHPVRQASIQSKATMNTGEYKCLSELTSLKRFSATLAGKVSAMAIN